MFGKIFKKFEKNSKKFWRYFKRTSMELKRNIRKIVKKKPVCVLGHAAKVKVLWTQLCMKMSKYIWTSIWNFFKISLNFFKNCPQLIFLWTVQLKFVKFVKILFSTPTWISSNYQNIFWQANKKFQVFVFVMFTQIHS